MPDVDKNCPVYVCGAYRNNCGISQGARLYADELEKAGRKVYRIDVTSAMRQPANLKTSLKLYPPEKIGPEAGLIIIHANPPLFYFALAALPREIVAKSRVIAFWAREDEKLPAFWHPAFACVDDIETPSKFSAACLRQHTVLPVREHPHALPVSDKRKTAFARDGILRILYVFDGGPSFERKNPWGALEAFSGAKVPAVITFKISNTPSAACRKFIERCAGIPGCQVITGDLSEDAMERLYLEHDVFLSLHHAEGYGLAIAEAWNYGLKVIATDCGGNTEFLPPECLVRVNAADGNPDSTIASLMLEKIYRNMTDNRASLAKTA